MAIIQLKTNSAWFYLYAAISKQANRKHTIISAIRDALVNGKTMIIGDAIIY